MTRKKELRIIYIYVNLNAMKKLILALLLIPMFAHSQSTQSARWSLIYEDKEGAGKTYIDTQTIEHLESFEAHPDVYSIWIKTLSKFSDGVYHQEDVAHMVFDMGKKQYGVKSIVSKKDGAIIVNNTVLFVQWSDVVPETNSEILLNYCKSQHKN